MTRLRFALLVNDKALRRWHLRCLSELEKTADLIGVIPIEAEHCRSGGRSSVLMRFFVRPGGEAGSVETASRLDDVPRQRNDKPLTDGSLHFVLKLGCGSVPDEVERTAPYGIWYFPHECDADPFPFLREVSEAEDVTHSALLVRRLTDGEVRTAILERGCFRTDKRSYTANRDRVLKEIAEWPALICRRLAAQPDLDLIVHTSQPIGRPAARARRPRLVRFGASMVRARLAVAWERLFRHKQWNIGVLRVPIGTLLSPGGYEDQAIEWFPLAGKGGFLADPFGLMRGDTLHLLCEYFDYRKGRGDICSLELSDHGFARDPRPAITLPTHMSYPFLIEDAGSIYCVPEACRTNEVSLFRAIEFPNTWTKAAVLVDHFGGVDPTIFRHDGRWWMMCTNKGEDADVKLWVWHTTDLFGPWTAHLRNPVKIDVRGARPGGTPFVHNGALYRPTQDCSKTYGGRIVIQRVTRLTPTEFREEPVAVLEPSTCSPFPLGRHTLTKVDDVVLIDGSRALFVWSAFSWFLKIWASEVWMKFSRRAHDRS